MASCDDDFSLLGEDHHHHHQTFTSFKATPINSQQPQQQSHPINILGGTESPNKAGGTTTAEEDGDEDYSGPPTFHDVNAFGEDESNPFGADDESDPNKSRANSRSEKRKDQEELSDGGTTYSYKKTKPTTTPNTTTITISTSSVGMDYRYRGEYRKDREEWSDTAIGTLLDAYMEKFVQLNRGNLRGRDWEEVATIVSERCDKQKAGKSVEQCKNKVDNLKKRYKVELNRMNSSGSTVSHWPWFKKIEQIVGNSPSSKAVSDEDKSPGSSANMLRQPKRYAVIAPRPVGMGNTMNPKSLSNPRWQRVVFKISGAALAGTGPQNIDPKVAMLIAREVAMACRLGVEVAIVIGGRNFFCGDTWVAATGLDRSTAYQIGMMATVMNSVLLQSALEKQGVQTRVQTAFPMHEVAEPYSKRRAIRHLEKGRVVIFGGVGAGTGNPLFTTDTAAALRASEINAEAVLKGTNVDGVYDSQSRNNNNVAFEHISYRELVSRGVTSMDMMAITFCEENGIPVVVFNLLEPGNISRALCGNQVGTLIDQSGRMS
ncbi:Aspartate/glutamate/uridylate kinase [Macleaya cordata]|uniref:UMP kinase n=1 Tax=Macleaya cordata TaxID=56857 RepID=A0A200R587_MACCD|nr:Aspartate/glutamate/uridylate kinase [Macleaya cordata]